MCFRYLNMSHVLQLGGVNEDIPYIYPQLQHKHFTGCIRNLVVDSKVTRSRDTQWHTAISAPGCKQARSLIELINGLIAGFNIPSFCRLIDFIFCFHASPWPRGKATFECTSALWVWNGIWSTLVFKSRLLSYPLLLFWSYEFQVFMLHHDNPDRPLN